MAWIETEAAVFRAWEDAKIARRLNDGFLNSSGVPDIQGFRDFSMSLRQSRVSRAGRALQFHFKTLLDERKVRYAMEPVIDGGEIPDFLFPGVAEYKDDQYPSERLRMLAAKFTAKDRWRQVLNEAKRIRPKHLLTLETGISDRQMGLMQTAQLILVMPDVIRRRYPQGQEERIVAVASFIDEVARL